MKLLITSISLVVCLAGCSDNTTNAMPTSTPENITLEISGQWNCTTSMDIEGEKYIENSILILENDSSKLQREVTLKDSSGNYASFAMSGTYKLTGTELSLTIDKTGALHNSGSINSYIIDQRIDLFENNPIDYSISNQQGNSLEMMENNSQYNVGCTLGTRRTVVAI